MKSKFNKRKSNGNADGEIEFIDIDLSAIDDGKVAKYKPKGFQLDIYDRSPTDPEQQAVFGIIYGLTDTGRSTLASTAPGPLLYLHHAEKMEGLIQDVNMYHILAHGYEIPRYDFSCDTTREQAEKKLINFAAALHDGLRPDNPTRTIIVDTYTDFYEVVRYASFGQLKPDVGMRETNYGKVNGYIRKIFWPARRQLTSARRSTGKVTKPKNVILIAHASPLYVKSQKTRDGKTYTISKEIPGRFVPGVGEGKSGNMVKSWADIMLCTSKDAKKFSRGTKVAGERFAPEEFRAVVDKPWMARDKRGAVYTGDELNLPFILSDITGRDISEWSE